jgi:hypothetical protein
MRGDASPESPTLMTFGTFDDLVDVIKTASFGFDYQMYIR